MQLNRLGRGYLIKWFLTTVCPRSSDPFDIVTLLYKMGHYFLGTRHMVWAPAQRSKK